MDSSVHRYARRLAFMIILFGTSLVPSATAADQKPPVMLAVQSVPAAPPENAEKAVEPASAEVVVANRTVAVLRSSWHGYSAAIRAREAEARIREQIGQNIWQPVTADRFEEGFRILVAGRVVFNLLDADLNPFDPKTPEQARDQVVTRLNEALKASWEQGQLSVILLGILFAFLGTAVYLALIWLCLWLLRKLRDRVARFTPAQLSEMHEELAGLFAKPLQTVVNWSLRLAVGTFCVILTYQWITYCLRCFPWTRPWGFAMRGFAFEQARVVFHGILAAIPGLIFVGIIFLITRGLTRLLGLLFLAVEKRKVSLPGLYPDTIHVTRRLVYAILWLFAVIISYPYLPGSDSTAFKGVSIMVGFLISFGSSGVISQVASGIVLVYSRAFKPGDFVQVLETEGTVLSIGILSTKIETAKREQVSIPNNVIMSSTSKNFSSLAESQGVIVYTSITIGYDTPWRQVHALLLMAADRTAGLGQEPPPFVLQKGLNDFYAEYQLNAYLLEPARRARVLADLHANIQDAFNEYGVQITSPHYEADPATPKIVPRTGWYAPPAKPPAEPPALGPAEAAGG